MLTKDTKLRFWCQKVLPLVYDDSLSYYELLNKVVLHLNQNTENINQLIDFYNTFAEDVEEIIQQMMEDGEFNEIVADTVGSLVAEEYDPEKTYVQYEYCIYEGKIYRANSTTTGTFDPEKWTEKTVTEDLTTLERYVYALDAGNVSYDDEAEYNNNTVGKELQTLDENIGNLTAGDVAYNSQETYDNATVGKELKDLKSAITTEFTQYNIAGKHVHIYHFGGNGNDWCFVRTPSTYDPKRAKPFPFVICNHGNGWRMDGTEQYANYTKRTMYVPLTDPDYIDDPTQYNGTADSSLWYSNPTIEALLTAGYIVCGAENYGDALYGNNNCRNGCVDFFDHMVNNYNVEKQAYMIGASNGALTTLNAAYLLQGKIKAIVLQYPICALVNQYEDNSSHRAQIRSAYNITDSDITLENLAKIVATHDPLTTDVIAGIKSGTIPPIKIWYSNSDTVAKPSVNSIPFFNLLKSSGYVCETVQASGGHGDYTHFDPNAIVSWFGSQNATLASFTDTSILSYKSITFPATDSLSKVTFNASQVEMNKQVFITGDIHFEQAVSSGDVIADLATVPQRFVICQGVTGTIQLVAVRFSSSRVVLKIIGGNIAQGDSMQFSLMLVKT